LYERAASVFERPRNDVDGEFEAEDERRTVLEAASRLSDDDQEVLRLTLWEELSTAETAVALGISVDAAKQRASRARRRLAAEFDLLTAPPATTSSGTTLPGRTTP
jgi:RNA polymerase sigma-70 factor (ECF subfamily)